MYADGEGREKTRGEECGEHGLFDCEFGSQRVLFVYLSLVGAYVVASLGWFDPRNSYGVMVCYASRVSAAGSLPDPETPRHGAVVRVTHWITVICFFALLISGGEIVISHPRFYWGETGNVMTRPLFTLPIPASRTTVPTGYGYVMPDQNGWSRSLHFQAAWAVVLTGLVYAICESVDAATSGKTWFRRGRTGGGGRFWEVIAKYLRRAPPEEAEAHSYNVMQRTHLSDGDLRPVSAGDLDGAGDVSGVRLPRFRLRSICWAAGNPRARCISLSPGALVLFLVVHVTMVVLAGFRSRMRAMITGRVVVAAAATVRTAGAHMGSAHEAHFTPQAHHRRSGRHGGRGGSDRGRASGPALWADPARSRRSLRAGQRR